MRLIIATIAVVAIAASTRTAHAHELELGFGYPHGIEAGLGLGSERVTFTLGVGGGGALLEDQEGDPSFAAATFYVPLGLKAYLGQPSVGRVTPTLRARVLVGATAVSDAFIEQRGVVLGGLATLGAAYLPTRAVAIGIEAGGYWDVVRWRTEAGPQWRDRYFGVVARVTLALRFGLGEPALDEPDGAD